MAHKALQVLQKKDIEVERYEFKKISAYLEVLRKEGLSGYFILRAGPATERFQRLFISPSTCRDTFRSWPSIVACDGTLTKSNSAKFFYLQ